MPIKSASYIPTEQQLLSHRSFSSRSTRRACARDRLAPSVVCLFVLPPSVSLSSRCRFGVSCSSLAPGFLAAPWLIPLLSVHLLAPAASRCRRGGSLSLASSLPFCVLSLVLCLLLLISLSLSLFPFLFFLSSSFSSSLFSFFPAGTHTSAIRGYPFFYLYLFGSVYPACRFARSLFSGVPPLLLAVSPRSPWFSAARGVAWSCVASAAPDRWALRGLGLRRRGGVASSALFLASSPLAPPGFSHRFLRAVSLRLGSLGVVVRAACVLSARRRRLALARAAASPVRSPPSSLPFYPWAPHAAPAAQFFAPPHRLTSPSPQLPVYLHIALPLSAITAFTFTSYRLPFPGFTPAPPISFFPTFYFSYTPHSYVSLSSPSRAAFFFLPSSPLPLPPLTPPFPSSFFPPLPFSHLSPLPLPFSFFPSPPIYLLQSHSPPLLYFYSSSSRHTHSSPLSFPSSSYPPSSSTPSSPLLITYPLLTILPPFPPLPPPLFPPPPPLPPPPLSARFRLRLADECPADPAVERVDDQREYDAAQPHGLIVGERVPHECEGEILPRKRNQRRHQHADQPFTDDHP